MLCSTLENFPCPKIYLYRCIDDSVDASKWNWNTEWSMLCAIYASILMHSINTCYLIENQRLHVSFGWRVETSWLFGGLLVAAEREVCVLVENGYVFVCSWLKLLFTNCGGQDGRCRTSKRLVLCREADKGLRLWTRMLKQRLQQILMRRQLMTLVRMRKTRTRMMARPPN